MSERVEVPLMLTHHIGESREGDYDEPTEITQAHLSADLPNGVFVQRVTGWYNLDGSDFEWQCYKREVHVIIEDLEAEYNYQFVVTR